MRSFGTKECLSRKCLPTDEAKHVFYFETNRCSVLDIQLKREPGDAWSVSISHAAEVLENWNLIGFQVSNIFSYNNVFMSGT